MPDPRAARRILSPLVLALLVLLPQSRARAEASDAAGERDDEAEIAADSPAAAMQGFLDACRQRDYDTAATYLDVPRDVSTPGPELARRLEAVLDRRAPIDAASLSPQSAGDRDDELPRGTDELGVVEMPDGSEEPVRIVRRTRPGPPWAFARATVARIDAWYATLENRWLLENLPAPLLRTGPLDLPWWQWAIVPLSIVLAWAIGYALARATRFVIVRISASVDAPMSALLTTPLTVAYSLGLLWLTLPVLGLHSRADAAMLTGLRTGALLVLFWLLSAALDVGADLAMRAPWGAAHPSSRALVPLTRRIGKVVILVLAVVTVLADFGYPIASLIAGLGIGGLVVALAAQKTVENLFGTLSIGADRPFREGDFVRVEDFEGTVETIGLRSTRFRTLERTIVTMPNGKLADMRIESLSARERFRLHCKLGLVFATTSEQLRAVLDGVKAALTSHPKLWTETLIVRFSAIGESSLDIEVMAWFEVRDWLEFREIREQMLFAFVQAVERAGTSFAFPTRTVHLDGATGQRD